MSDSNLHVAKIVASPTNSGWSQVYSAGKLFAAISLFKDDENQEKDHLNILGKEILNNLEQEFFTLETKDLESIRQAVLTTSEKIPTDVNLSFVIGAVIGNILYLYILGNGKVSIKRVGTIGTLLEVKDQMNNSLKEASGYLQEEDVIILQTKDFSETISDTTLSEFLDNPAISDAAENLAPLVHEKENPTAAAILIQYTQPVKSQLFATLDETEEENENPSESQQELPSQKPAEYINAEQPFDTYETTKSNINVLGSVFGFFGSLGSKLGNLNPKGLTKTRKIILLVVVLIIIIFAASLFFALKKQDTQKLTQDFSAVYPQAEKKYEEGQSLIDLNQTLAQDSFAEAKNILENGKAKFPADSTQAKQINELLTKVNQALGSAPKTTTTTTTQTAKEGDSPYLDTVKSQTGSAFTKDDTNTYFINTKGIYSVKNGSSSTNEIIKNDDDWAKVGGLATYNTNMYVLDKSDNQIYKFLNNGAAYTKSDYLTANVKADFAKAVSATIDNNIYVLYSDGTIDKYFKGNSVDFTVKGLNKELVNPTKIYSTPDFDFIYILDLGNSRIVKLDKTGSFKGEIVANVIKGAVDFDIDESGKVAYVLSSGKIYTIKL